ncbi:MAG: hypothetical protein ABSE43_00970 [Steroidobacteraceae bacterium]|jgi:hypothetical protein
MSREASRLRAQSIAASVAQLSARLADPALMGYPVTLLCNPLQRPALKCEALRGSSNAEATPPAVEACGGSNYKE